MASFIPLFAELTIYLLLLGYTVYTVVLGYHWFNYGTSTSTSLSAMVVFLCGAGALFLTLVSIFQFL